MSKRLENSIGDGTKFSSFSLGAHMIWHTDELTEKSTCVRCASDVDEIPRPNYSGRGGFRGRGNYTATRRGPFH